MISVLYVDDEVDLLEIARIFLEKDGEFSVGIMPSVQEALNSPLIETCDVIISDYQMPGMDGIAFLKTVRRRFKDLPFILFTGRGREEVVIEAINNGADFYLQKGGDPKAQFAELAHKIRQAVARRRAFHALRDSERRLSDIINFLPDATFAINKTGHVIAWNRAMEEMSGTSAADIVGKGDYWYSQTIYKKNRPMLIDLVLVPDEQIENTLYLNVSRDDQSLTAETLLEKPGLPSIHLWGKASRLYDEDGNLTGAIESIRDITDRKTAEEALSESEKKYREFIRDSPIGVFLSDSKGRFLEANPAMCHISGRSEEELAGFTVHDLIQKKEMEEIAKAARTMEGPETIPGDFPLRQSDGKIVWVQTDIIRIGTDRFLGFIHDIDRRKQAEDALLWKTAFFEAQAESSHDGILVVNDKNQRILTNRRLIEMWDIPPQILADPDDTPLLAYVVSKTRNPEQFYQKVLELYAHDKETSQDTVEFLDGTVFERYTAPVIGRDGRYYGRIWTFHDISERTQQVDELKDHAGRQRAFIDAISDMAFVKDPAFHYTMVNKAYCDFFGKTEDQILGRNDYDLYPQDEAETCHESDQQALFENHLIVKAEKIGDRTYEVRKIPIRRGDMTGVGGIMRDITDQLRSDAALRESEKKFRDIFNNTNDALQIIELDENTCTGKFLDVNDISCRMDQYSREEFLRLRTVDLDGGRYSKQGGQIVRELRELGGSTFEAVHKRKDGSTYPCEVSLHPVLLQGKHVVIAAARDISDRKKAEDAMKKAHQQLTLLTGITRHDILNNITIMFGFLALAKKQAAGPEMERIIKKIEDRTNQIGRQIEFTRIYEDLGNHVPLWQDLHAITEKIPVHPGITIANTCTGIEVLADVMLQNVFANLIDNSVRHGGKVTEIRISASVNDGNLRIAYDDDGIGIPAGEKERIFDRGFGKNTGLGLFLAREILALTGITIAERGEPGRGARFEMDVPKGAYRVL